MMKKSDEESGFFCVIGTSSIASGALRGPPVQCSVYYYEWRLATTNEGGTNVAKLTDKQRKKIIAESVNGSSIRALAARYGVSTTTIQRVLKSDTTLTQKVAQKKAENTASILAFMDSKKNDVCGLIDKLLAAMGDEDKLATATVNQLATAMGIVIDKYTANEAIKSSDAKETNFFEAIHSAGKEVDLSAIPELQSSAERDPLLVDETGTPE